MGHDRPVHEEQVPNPHNPRLNIYIHLLFPQDILNKIAKTTIIIIDIDLSLQLLDSCGMKVYNLGYDLAFKNTAGG
jgi:hypothetical protein